MCLTEETLDDLMRVRVNGLRRALLVGPSAFDYLAMVGKLGLAEIEPDSTYMTGLVLSKAAVCCLAAMKARA